MPKNLRATAAWRISIWTTLAFALGTAVAFSIVYFLVAQGIRERSDTWLTGEAEVLAQVSADTPSDHLYKRLRSKVDHDTPRPLIHTIRGVGYVLRESLPRPWLPQLSLYWPHPPGSLPPPARVSETAEWINHLLPTAIA